MNRKMNRNDVLEALGFSSERRDRNDLVRTMLPAVGLFGAGMLVGAGLALALAPKPGRELRADVYRGAGQLGQNLKQRLPVGRDEEIRASATEPVSPS